MFDYAKFQEENYIRPIAVPEKEELYHDINEIADSIGGFIGDRHQVSYELVREAERLLVNAISVFEKGYFDAAFYLLRESIEVGTTFIYLFDLPEERRVKELAAWRSSVEHFPMKGQMQKELDKFGEIYSNMKSCMPSFFGKLDATYKRLNKYVHKQGFRYLYIARWRLGNKGRKADQTLLRNFIKLTRDCIGLVAGLRLMIDPMPILQGEDEIDYRLGDVIGEPYSPRFLERYLGDGILDEYKRTSMYKDFRDDILSRERMSDVVYEFVREYHVGRSNIDAILSQTSLLSWHQLVILELIRRYSWIACVRMYRGLMTYFTDVRSNNTSPNFSSADFEKIEKGERKANVPFRQAYLTLFKVGDDDFFLEHNEELDFVQLQDLGNAGAYMARVLKARNEQFAEMLSKVSTNGAEDR